MKNLSLVIILLSVIFDSSTSVQSAQTTQSPSDFAIEKFILANPEIILESLKRYEEKIAVTTDTLEQKIIENELKTLKQKRSSYIGGNPDGSITMIEFIDYKCGYCKRAHEQIVTLLESNSEIRFVVKEFPILGAESEMASKASIAILLYQGEEVYKAFTSKLLKFNGTINMESIQNLIGLVDGKSIDIRKQMESKAVYEVINSNYALATKLKIRGTPTFIIGTEIVRGYKDIETLQNIINKSKQEL